MYYRHKPTAKVQNFDFGSMKEMVFIDYMRGH
jgi:hypothetical protein